MRFRKCEQLQNRRAEMMIFDLSQNQRFRSVNPLGEVVAGLQSSLHLRGVHRLVLGHIFSILPFEEFDAILGLWLAAEVAVGSSLLVLRLAKSQGQGDGTWAAVELDL